jgi:hypothetical protein
MEWTQLVEVVQSVDWAMAARVGGPWLVTMAIFLFVIGVERRKAAEVRALVTEGRDVLVRIKEERQSVEWLLGRMKEKIEEKNAKERRRSALDEAETQMDRIIADHGGMTVGDAGQRMDEALRPTRRHMVELENTALGDCWVVPAEDATRLSRVLGARPRRSPLSDAEAAAWASPKPEGPPSRIVRG